jgi:hypothetical protein
LWTLDAFRHKANQLKKKKQGQRDLNLLFNVSFFFLGNKMKNKIELSKKIEKLLEEERLDSIVKEIMNQTDFHKVCLAFSNVCVGKSNDLKRIDKIISRKWYRLARILHKNLEDETVNKEED